MLELEPYTDPEKKKIVYEIELPDTDLLDREGVKKMRQTINNFCVEHEAGIKEEQFIIHYCRLALGINGKIRFFNTRSVLENKKIVVYRITEFKTQKDYVDAIGRESLK